MTTGPARSFPPLDPASLDPAQRALAEQLLTSSKGYGGGPIPMLLRSPEMSRRLRALIVYFARETRLPRRLCELAILIQARFWDQDYEWWAHAPLAIDAGLSKMSLDHIRAGDRPPDLRDDEAAVYDLLIELLDRHHPRATVIAAARAHLADREIVDLIGLSGTYATLALLLNLAGEGAPSAAPRPDPGSTRRQPDEPSSS